MASQAYYNEGAPPLQQQQGYPPPQQYPMQPQNGGYQQAPPNYGQNYGQPGPQPGQTYAPQDGKNTFDQAFKIEKPKWNDLWAGILVRDATLHLLAS